MSIYVDLITPERLAFSDKVDFIAAPASDGEIGILPNHTPLLTRLGFGELRLVRGQTINYIAISGGFLEVQRGNRVSIFAETAEIAEEIDVARARQSLAEAKAKLTEEEKMEVVDFATTEAAISRAIMRIRIAENAGRRKGPQGTR